MASRRPVNDRNLRALLIGFAALVVVAFVVYAPSIKGPFIWDDGQMIFTNANVRASDGLGSIWSGRDVDYFPVTSTMFWFEWRLFGSNPVGYRIINILLHACSSFLIWRILTRLRIPGAGVAAAIFCVHPICVATVAWVAEQKNTLSLLLALLSVWFFLRAESPREDETTASQTNRTWLYWLSVALFLLALLSKISVVTLPIVLLFLADWKRRGAVWRVALFFVLSLALGIVNVLIHHRNTMAVANANEIESLATRSIGGGYAVWFYLAKALLPIHLTVIYPRWNVSSAALEDWVPLLLWLIVLIGCAFAARKYWVARAAFYGLGFFWIMLLPVLGVVQISFTFISRVSDHLDYIGVIGICALVGWVLALATQRLRWFKPVPIIFVAILAVASFSRAALYAHPEQLWKENIAQNPKAAMAWANLGAVLKDENRADEAVDAYRRSIALDPDNLSVREDYAGLLMSLRRLDEAIAQYREILRHANNVEVYGNLGAALLMNGEPDEAISIFTAAIRVQPNNAQMYNNLGVAFGQKRRYDEAIKAFSEAVRLAPDDAGARNNLEDAKRLSGRP